MEVSIARGVFYNLAKQGQAPRFFQDTSPGGVPRRAISGIQYRLVVWGIAQLSGAGKGLCVGHVDCNLRRHLDLDRYPTVANEIPEKPKRDRTRSAGFPNAFLSLQFVARISFPGACHRIDGLFPGYPGSFARRSTVASAADSAFLWVQTQCHSHPEPDWGRTKSYLIEAMVELLGSQVFTGKCELSLNPSLQGLKPLFCRVLKGRG